MKGGGQIIVRIVRVDETFAMRNNWGNSVGTHRTIVTAQRSHLRLRHVSLWVDSLSRSQRINGGLCATGCLPGWLCVGLCVGGIWVFQAVVLKSEM